MTRFVILTTVFLALLGARSAFSTTVVPPTFDELVTRSSVIFEGEVVDERSVWETTSDGRHIVTIVTFSVSRVLKGQLGLQTQLSFLGGTIGNRSMRIEGMPVFQLGDRDVLFVSGDQNAASPLVGLWHGRFRIVRDNASGQQVVRAHNGAAVVIGLDAFKAPGPTATPNGPLRLQDFESLVAEKVRARSQP